MVIPSITPNATGRSLDPEKLDKATLAKSGPKRTSLGKQKIFGTPTFFVNDKIFWGQDRLKFALDEYNK